MKNSRTTISILSLIGLIISAYIAIYYWESNSYVEIRYVPMQIMLLALIYIGLQFLKRTISKQQNWWDWLYYVGLTTIALPIFIATPENFNLYLTLAKIGSLFLVIPILIEGFYIVKQQKA